VGVVRIAPAIPKHASLWIVLTFLLELAVWQPDHHTKDANLTCSLMIVTKSQLNTLDLRPHVTSQALIQADVEFRASLTLTSTCSFQARRESSITPRYLTDKERCLVVTNKRGSKKPDSFLLLVIAIIPVLSWLTDRPNSSHHASKVWRANCIIPVNKFGNS